MQVTGRFQAIRKIKLVGMLRQVILCKQRNGDDPNGIQPLPI